MSTSPTSYLKGQVIGPATTRTRWMFRNMSYMVAFAKFSKAKMILGRVNLALGKLGYNDPLYVQRLQEYNAVMLELSQARWYSSVGIITRKRSDWKKALHFFKEGIGHGEALLKMMESGSGEPLDIQMPALSSQGTEITYADGAPIVPEVCPLVVLAGTSYEMGYQYAQQLVQIFGPWVLEKKAQRKFTGEAVAEIRKWEAQIQKYAPEILDMCKGWGQGARDLGIEMSYQDVLEIWTGHMPPKTTYMGRGDKISDAPPPIACSGNGAWGRATKDGKLVTGSSGDHDPSFPVVIMAYPDTGHNFMFTTFAAAGDIVLVGSQHMFGFPGINSKGLAYIEHGGQPRLIEPRKYWGYGLRRAASVFHILRYADNAKEALEMEMDFPVGDAGMDNGTVGGFYADSEYGYVLESRKEPVIVREAGYMGETDFLYANNSAMHRDAAQAGWMRKDQADSGDWKWDAHGGWYPEHVTGFKLSELFKGGEGQAIGALRGMYRGCLKRNLYSYEMLNRGLGHIDMEYMKMLYRHSGTIPGKPWKQANKEYNKSGLWGDVSVGNASNGIITVTKPDEGLYAVCTGEARRGIAPSSPFLASFCPMYGETNAFWEVKLADGPQGTAEYARRKAEEYLTKTEALLNTDDTITDPGTLDYMRELVAQSKAHMRQGREAVEEAGKTAQGKALYGLARAARAFTRAQVYALMARNIIKPPPQEPEELL
jgi:hypothetical protein